MDGKEIRKKRSHPIVAASNKNVKPITHPTENIEY